MSADSPTRCWYRGFDTADAAVDDFDTDEGPSSGFSRFESKFSLMQRSTDAFSGLFELVECLRAESGTIWQRENDCIIL